jgi:hypothetical protein
LLADCFASKFIKELAFILLFGSKNFLVAIAKLSQTSTTSLCKASIFNRSSSEAGSFIKLDFYFLAVAKKQQRSIVKLPASLELRSKIATKR